MKIKIYDRIISEVKKDVSLIAPDEVEYGSYMEAVKDTERGKDTVILPEDVEPLQEPLDVFSDYDVRDAVILTALQDEEFAFVLVNKVAGAVLANKNKLSQHDMEALAVIANLTCMWGQFNHTITTLEALSNFSKDKSELSIPELAKLTVRIMEQRETFPFEMVRKGTSNTFADVLHRLNTNTEGA